MLEPREQRGRQQGAWDCEVGADRAAHLRRHALLPPRRFMLREHRRADDEIAVRSEQLLESSGCQPRDRAEKRPLVRPRLERLRIEEDACARGSAASLQRQRDQVAESFLRQEVLVGEEPVVARQVDLGPPGHRVAQQQCAEPPRRAGSDRRREEDPDVAAITGAAAFQRSRHPVRTACLEQRERVELPRPSVEVAGEKPTGVVFEQRIDPDRLLPAQMMLDCLVSERQIRPRPALRPSIGGRRNVTALSRSGALPAQGVHGLAASKEPADQRDLLGRGSTRIELKTRCRLATFASTDDRLRALCERDQSTQPLVLRA